MAVQHVNSDTLQFGEPLRQEVLTPGNVRCFYLQEISNQNLLTNQNQNFYFQSDWFTSDPPKLNAYQKSEILVKNSAEIRMMLQFITDSAMAKAVLPNEVAFHEAKEKKELFKPIPKTDNFFVKIDRGIQCYDKTCTAIPYESLSFGKYRVIVHVKSVYYGRHGEEPHKASLVLKVAQLQYEKQTMPCLFLDEPLANKNISEPPLATSTPIDVKKKRTRPRLQRQNTIPAEDLKNVDTIFKDLGL